VDFVHPSFAEEKYLVLLRILAIEVKKPWKENSVPKKGLARLRLLFINFSWLVLVSDAFLFLALKITLRPACYKFVVYVFHGLSVRIAIR
jgi:hypothetical protein